MVPSNWIPWRRGLTFLRTGVGHDPGGPYDPFEAPLPMNSWWKKTPGNTVTSSRSGDIVVGDALATLESLRASVADVVFLDPPFNLGKRYGKQPSASDRLAEDAYDDYIRSVIVEASRILVRGGSLYLYHIPRWALRLSRHLERSLSFRHWIAVAMKNGFVRGDRLYPAHYALLHYTKGVPNHQNRPKIPPQTCRHCGEFVRDYGGYKQFIAHGINLSDVWDDLSPVRHARYKHRVANELPVAIPLRALQMSGRPRGLVVDPFAGTGTTGVAAKMEGMRFVLGDSEREHCLIMRKRIGNLRSRAKPKP